MILFQVLDLAAKACGEPHLAPSWDIAKASLGAMLAKTLDLAERAHSIKIEEVGPWDPQTGIGSVYPLGDRSSEFGDVCLAEFRAACAKEEYVKQEEAENDG